VVSPRDAFILRKEGIDHRRFTAGLVFDQFAGGERHDFRVEQARCLGSSGPLLARQRIGILCLTRDAIAACHQFCRFQHGHISSRNPRKQARVALCHHQLQRFPLDDTDLLDSATHGDFMPVDNDLFGRRGDRH